MPLLQDSIQIALTSNMIKYYERLGYEIPRSKDARGRLKVKEGTTIIVKVEDLKPGCGIPVHMACDICGKAFSRIWKDHKAHDGLIYCKNCSGRLRSGEKAYNWNPSLTKEDRVIGRDTSDNKDFIRRVMARDHYTCKVCGKTKDEESLQVHHLNGYNWCVDGRTDDNNGITLCIDCHYNFHSIYGRGNNTKEQFEEWIGSPIGELGEGIFPPAKRVICMDDGIVHKSAPAAARYYKLDRNAIYPVLNMKLRAVFDTHFLWYNEYEKMEKEDICNYWRWVTGKRQSYSTEET